MRAIHLRCDNLKNPLGLGDIIPRFSWHCEGGIRQNAYQIIARREGEVIWDTGKVMSASMTHIIYDGQQLKSKDHIMWSVRLWDENNYPGKWNEAFFEMGLLDADDWSAKWIRGDYKPKKNQRYPADCFQKKFFLKNRVKEARLYITACGFYEAYINGVRIGNYVLAPGSTDYRYRLQYQIYDVTETLIMQGKGAEISFELLLGDGWFRGSIGCFGKTNVFGRETKILAQLNIQYEDGSRETIGTDQSFSWSNDGPIRQNDFKDGEEVEAFRKPSYGGKAQETRYKLIPGAADNVPITEHEQFRGKLILTPSGKRVIDFGQNLAGFLSFSIHGKKGQKVKLTLGEMLDENGEFTQKNMVERKPIKEFGRMTEILLMTGNAARIKDEMQVTPRQQILFSCSGGEDEYRTRFALFGFRYVLVETEMEVESQIHDEDDSLPYEDRKNVLRAENFRAIAVYSDMERTGNFSCSHEKINQLFSNILWSMRSNFIDIPMDCPTRERMGWTGDAQIFFRSASYLYDVSSFYRKWLRDMKDAQNKKGKIPAVIPYNGFSMLYDNTGGSVGWADAMVLIPYRFYKIYGDKRLLCDVYGMCRRYALYMIHNAGPEKKKEYLSIPHRQYIYEKGFHLGEWLEPEEFKDHIVAGKKIKHTEIATAFFYLTMQCMSEIAEIIGETEDQKLWEEYAKGAKKAYGELFLKTVPDTDRQAKLVRPLAFGLAQGSEETTDQQLACRLCKALEHYQYRVGTGFLSTPFLLEVLTQTGHTETAYKVLENEQMPGWLYEVNQRATTVWEDWEGKASHNHYSPGAVCEWLFGTCAGIRVDGENHFLITPAPGGSLTNASAEYKSPYGVVKSSWNKDGEKIQYSITLPPNTTAKVILPGGFVTELSAGTYRKTV